MFKPKYKWEQEISKIESLGKEGKSLQEIANLYGISKQRLHQIIKPYIKNWNSEYGRAVLRKEKNKKYKKKWGDKTNSLLYRQQRNKFRQLKYRVKSKQKEKFDLDFSDIIWNTYCPILGIELNYFNNSCEENSASFDKIIPEKGYVNGNVQVISWRANRIKNDGSFEEHFKIAEYLKKLLHPS